ncbi:cytochrome P450 [Mycena olivaceomarginata]|nr:cytochrome P450 [Mycena olivaceomarginata]
MDGRVRFIGGLLVVAAYVALRRKSTIRTIPGPPSPSWIFGQTPRRPPFVADPIALQYILNSPQFPHGPTQKNGIDLVFPNKCVMNNHGDTHKRLRAAMNAGFTSAAVRNFLPIFERVAQTMVEKLEESSGSQMDVCPVLSEATLSTDLDANLVDYNERMLTLASNQSAAQILADAVSVRLPKWVLRAATGLPTETFNIIRTAKSLANQLGEKVIREKMDVARQGLAVGTDAFDMLRSSERRKNTLTFEEVRSPNRDPSHWWAGHYGNVIHRGYSHTYMSNTLAFGLLELARHPEFQEQLRAEIHASRATASSAISYDTMPLLNAFVKARFKNASPHKTWLFLSQTRSRPRPGERINQIPVRKGQVLNVAIASYHRLESRWGKDALEFRPSRWLDGTISQDRPSGRTRIWAPTGSIRLEMASDRPIRSLTFLGGPRVVSGRHRTFETSILNPHHPSPHRWRFAILEMQVFFAELAGKFAFTLPEEGDPIHMRFAGSLMPVLPTDKKSAPLCVTPDLRSL